LPNLKRFTFNQGLDCRIIDKPFFFNLKNYGLLNKMKPLIYAWDGKQEDEYITKAIKLANYYGVKGTDIKIYMLWNFTDSPEEIWNRIKTLQELKVNIYPMQYAPLKDINRKFMGEKWTEQQFFNFRQLIRNFFNNSIGSGLTKERFEILFGKTEKEFVEKMSKPIQHLKTNVSLRKGDKKQDSLFGGN
jgi:hypothetical protein